MQLIDSFRAECELELSLLGVGVVWNLHHSVQLLSYNRTVTRIILIL